MPRPAACLVTAAALVLSGAGALSAQCTTAWSSDGGVPGTLADGVSAIVAWDPDGAGPLGERVVLGGSFSIAGDALVSSIAVWDPSTGAWSTLGSGIAGTVSSIVALQNGHLIVGGSFSIAGGALANNIARWNGTSWSALGSGVDSAVDALTVLPNGDVVAGGSFQTAGGVPASLVARWNGSTWSPLGSGLGGPPPGLFQPPHSVFALTTMANGDVAVGGRFAAAGAVAVQNVARWNGSTWSAFGGGTNDTVYALKGLANGDLVAGGPFTAAGGNPANGIARWTGASWFALGAGVTGSIFFGTPAVFDIATTSNGDLVAAGRFQTAGSVTANSIARWNGSSWVALGTGADNTVLSLAVLTGGSLVAGGSFSSAGGRGALHVARWSGSVWEPLEDGLGANIRALATLPNGDVVAGGAGPIARRTASGWTQLGSPGPSLDLAGNGGVYALTTLPGGDVVAGGAFTLAGGVPANRLARWNGVAWSPIGGGVTGPFAPAVNAAVTMPNGDLVVAGRFTFAGGVPAQNIARWNGSGWSALGAGTSDEVRALVAMPNGDLIVGGSFASADGVAVDSIARWDGAAWHAIGGLSWFGSLGVAHALAVRPNGDLVVAGSFSSVGGVAADNIARWDGAAWHPLGTGLDSFARSVVALPDGDVVAGGTFAIAGGVVASRIARWNGLGWSAVGTGVNGDVAAMSLAPSGSLAVGGEFTIAGGAVSAYFARITTNCPASAVSSGLGCAGATLTATTLPWVDATLRTTGTGLPAASIVLVVTSVTPVAQSAVPLTVAFPQAGAGCDLLVAPDILGVLVTFTGTAQSDLFLPNVPPLVGVTFYQQMVPIEVGAGGAWTSVVATNALQLTGGML